MYTASFHHHRRRHHGSCHHGGYVFLLGITRVVVLVLLLLLLSSLSLTCCSQTHTLSSSSSSPLSSFQRPELYHPEESKATDHYFEGWYHKLVRTTITASDNITDNSNNTDSLSMAVVPGIFYGYSSSTSTTNNDINNETMTTTTMMNKKNESHAFIFVTINGEEQHYYRFNLDTEFRYVKFSNNKNNKNENKNGKYDANANANANDNDYIQIGNNTFSKYGMSLDLIPRRWNNKGQQIISHDDIVNNTPEQENENENDNATITLKGSIKYKNLSPWPIQSKYNLGAMGPIGYIFSKSFLECYHDVLSFDHTIIGTLIINNTYIEEFYDSDHNDYTNITDLNSDNSGKEKEEVSCNNNEDNNNSQQCAAITDDNNNNNVSRRKTNTNTYSSSIISRGYVEKDRGRSFPSLWIWIQTNSFPKYIGTSLFFSVARIPILTSIVQTKLFQLLFVGSVLEFPGFTAAVWLNNNNNNNNNNNQYDYDNDDDPTIITSKTATATKRLIPFATWTGAYFEKLIIDEERVVIELNSGSIRKGVISILWDHYYYHDDSSSSSSSSSSIIILIGRYIRAWFGSWFVTYDTRKSYYRLELIVNRKNVPHIMLYAPTTTTVTTIINGTSSSSSSSSTSNASTTTTTTISSKMKPFVNEALNAKVHMRLYEYYYDDNDNNNNGDNDDDDDDSDNGGEDLKRSRLDGSRSSSSRERVRLLIDDIGEHAGLEIHQNVQYLVDNLCGKPTANRFVCL